MQQKILLVGDDRHTQNALAEALSLHRYQILTASSKGEALFQLDVAQPDLIILDTLPSDTDRREILERIRELSPIPIIALGVPHDRQDEIESLDHGADYFITKPVALRELGARVRALLRRASRESTPAKEDPSQRFWPNSRSGANRTPCENCQTPA